MCSFMGSLYQHQWGGGRLCVVSWVHSISISGEEVGCV